MSLLHEPSGVKFPKRSVLKSEHKKVKNIRIEEDLVKPSKIETLIKVNRGFKMSQLVQHRREEQVSYFKTGRSINKIITQIYK